MNQDEALAAALEGGWVLLAVADGVGGAPGGELASKAAIDMVAGAFSEHPVTDPRHSLLGAVSAANGRVREMAATDADHPSMATTLVVALVDDGGRAWVASVGDSRAYALLGGELRQLTEDDSWVAERVRLGEMTEAEAEESLYKNVITRAIGSEDSAEAGEIAEVQLEPGDALLLCTDGLYRMVSDTEMAALLKQASPVDSIARRLVEMANDAGGVDNIGVALFRV
jgi:protein phosphatase